MADTWIQGSFAFRCTQAELALIEEAFEASYELADVGGEAPPPSAALAALFPPINPNDPWSGFRAIFSDPRFVGFGADLRVQDPVPDDPNRLTVWVYGMTDFQPEPIAALLQRTCQQTLAEAPVTFEWCVTCSGPETGGFSGGWCAVFPDRIKMESSSEALRRALAGDVS